jgi:arylsulfatase A-like enzyme
VFLSDNGGAAEDPGHNGPNGEIGSRDSYRGYARPWATVSNTPFRHHKVTNYEGGISTPLLARWPAGIPKDRDGSHVREPAHVIDLLPSFLELAGATYPSGKGAKLEGQSIVPMLEGGHGNPDRIFYWEHEGNRGVRMGKWMLVTLPGANREFELYDIDTDRIQSHDVAAENPEVVKKMEAMYASWAARVGVIPWPPHKGSATTKEAPVEGQEDGAR